MAAAVVIDAAVVRAAVGSAPALPVLGRAIDLSQARPASVLVPVRLAPEPRVVLVVRAAGLRDHAGEVGFPGGKPEPGDADLAATALREAEEEIAIAPGEVDVVGELRSVPVITGRYVIHPFVGLVADRAAPRVAASEIERLVEVPIGPLLSGERAFSEVRGTWRGVPVTSPHLDVGGAILYGASAYILYELVLRIAEQLGVTLPPPRLETEPPWGDRYAGDGA